MIDRLCAIAWALTLISLLAVAGAQAQTAQSPTSSPADTAGSKSPAQATGQPDKPSGPQINTAEIVARANKTVGVDIQKRITAWQQGLSRLESDLQKPRLRYSELNDFRDELQRVRGEIDGFRTHLEPALTAAKDQLGLLGPAPAAGQPPEPEDVAQSRAERNYYLGLLSAGQAGSTPPICTSTTSSIRSRTSVERISRRACCSRSLASTRLRPGRGCRTTSRLRLTVFGTS